MQEKNRFFLKFFFFSSKYRYFRQYEYCYLGGEKYLFNQKSPQK